jgi:hydroxyethylthiazole kinase
VFDPVGAGATKLRTTTTERIRSGVKVTVVRGNAAELATIAGMEAEIRGVDSVASGDPVSAARLTALRFGGAAVVSGAVDHVSDGDRVADVLNGHPLMGRITGSGCMATAIVGAFLAVEPDPFLAGVEAMIAFGVAGELAAERSAGPGTFRTQLIDAVAALDEATILARARASIREARPA